MGLVGVVDWGSIDRHIWQSPFVVSGYMVTVQTFTPRCAEPCEVQRRNFALRTRALFAQPDPAVLAVERREGKKESFTSPDHL